MKCDIERLLGAISDKVPSQEDEDGFLIWQGQLPQIENSLFTDRLVIKKGEHVYGSYKIDMLTFISDKRGYRNLGLLILSLIFSERESIDLLLTHKNSEIRKLVITSPKVDLDNVAPGYYETPFAFSYWPDDIETHPWTHSDVARYDLPHFSLTNEDDFLLSNNDWENRDVISGFGRNKAGVLLAELLLNMSRPQEIKERVVLECEAGFTGVSPSSAEATFYIAENDEYSREIFNL